jgi:FtsZ-interacting cell division protein ZipA
MAIRVTRAGVALTVGIIVVTGLIIGGLFWIRGAGEQARQNDAAKIAQQQLEEESKSGVALNEGDDEKSNENESQSSGENNATNNSTNQSTSNQTSGISSGSNGTASNNSASELPQTGAGDMMPALALMLVTFSTVSYLVSKRQLSKY